MFLLRHDSPQIAIDGVHTAFDLLPTNAPFAVEREEERDSRRRRRPPCFLVLLRHKSTPRYIVDNLSLASRRSARI